MTDLTANPVLSILASRGPMREYHSSTGPGWNVRCPCYWNHSNGDMRPSARVWVQNGTLCVWCGKGCTWKEWRQAIGLPNEAWHTEPRPGLDRAYKHFKPERPQVIREYQYTAEDGEWLFTVVRTKHYGVKGFYQYRPIPQLPPDHVAVGLAAGWYEFAGIDGGNRHKSYRYAKDQGDVGRQPGPNLVYVPACRRVLWKLDELANLPADLPVVLVEGEKDAENVTEMTGNFATTLPGGAAKGSQATCLAPLAGRNVFVLCDHNEVGYKHMRLQAGTLMEVGAASITTCPWKDRDHPFEGMDVSDWLLRLPEAGRADAFRGRSLEGTTGYER